MTGRSVHARLYGRLLALQPRTFRDAYRADMVQLFQDDLRDRGPAKAWRRSLADLVVSAPTQRWEAHMARPSSPAATVATTGIALAVVLTVLAFGHAVVITLPLALGAAWYVAQRHSLTPYRDAVPAASDQWYRYLGAGALIFVVQALGVEFGPDWLTLPWMILVLSFLLAWVLVGTGALLGIVALGRRWRLRHHMA